MSYTFHLRTDTTEDTIALLLFKHRRGIHTDEHYEGIDYTSMSEIFRDAILNDKITSDELDELLDFNAEERQDLMQNILSSQQEIVDHWRKESYWLSNPVDPNSDELWAKYQEAQEHLTKIRNFFRDGPVSDSE